MTDTDFAGASQGCWDGQHYRLAFLMAAERIAERLLFVRTEFGSSLLIEAFVGNTDAAMQETGLQRTHSMELETESVEEQPASLPPVEVLLQPR